MPHIVPFKLNQYRRHHTKSNWPAYDYEAGLRQRCSLTCGLPMRHRGAIVAWGSGAVHDPTWSAPVFPYSPLAMLTALTRKSVRVLELGV